ncbi:ABC transporter ATP-binding protein [Roseomonas xinghualingensis]|uniref:ABC transporter ATP-binding protein n=1 Tax=Roseomonas xinghualingensis TaxID=2986475 RepID=UPI0021F0E879|nr:ATP-binding cassette domain-containing protein [Roseomonas sp. SXEYE001]MCV4207211.1 ATP-binding cassette domain-containing protein [Roseomonas sp. SXEYE001]
MTSSTPALRVEGLGVRYGALVALEGVSWQVHAGEILGIIGPNGAGKSSCYDATTHMVTRDGKVWLDGQDVTAVPPYGLAPLGLKRAFQQNAFFATLSVLDNMVAVLAREAGTGLLESLFLPWREAARRRALEEEAAALLERFGVPRDMHALRPGNIPYGSQRMLSIALAFGRGARVLMLDEPAAGLGGADMERLAELLRGLRAESVAIVVIEHHMDLIMSVADRIVVLEQGRCLATGTPHEIQNDHRVLEAYLGQAA